MTKTPTKAQARFLEQLGRYDGAGADLTFGSPETAKAAGACVKAGWVLEVGNGAAHALTWAGWGVVPKLFADDAGAVVGVSGATFADYADRGHAPAPDGYAEHPDTKRAARFWFPWTIEAWQASREQPRAGRAPGAQVCTYRAPGSTGRGGYCRRAILLNGTCSAGHTDSDRGAGVRV